MSVIRPGQGSYESKRRDWTVIANRPYLTMIGRKVPGLVGICILICVDVRSS